MFGSCFIKEQQQCAQQQENWRSTEKRRRVHIAGFNLKPRRIHPVLRVFRSIVVSSRHSYLVSLRMWPQSSVYLAVVAETK